MNGEALRRDEDNAIASIAEIQEFLTSVMRGETTEEALTNSGSLIEKEVSAKDRMLAGKELLRRNEAIKRITMDERKLSALEKQLENQNGIERIEIEW